jgi:predicted sulfurtransferase
MSARAMTRGNNKYETTPAAASDNTSTNSQMPKENQNQQQNNNTCTDLPFTNPLLSVPGSGGDTTGKYTILAFYQFITVGTEDNKANDLNNANSTGSNLSQLRSDIEMTLRTYNVRGSIIMATEGINGTISYPTPTTPISDRDGSCGKGKSNICSDDDPVVQFLSSIYKKLKMRKSFYTQHVFYRLKVRIKSEIVTLGEIPLNVQLPTESTTTHIACTRTDTELRHEKIDTNLIEEMPRTNNKRVIHPSSTSIGQYVQPGIEWDTLLDDPNCTIIDVRNSYEVSIGTFENAINPNTTSFIEFTGWLQNYLQHNRPKKIAMFCTGGIRCEKSTSLCNQLLLGQQQQLQQDDTSSSPVSTCDSTKYELPPVYHLDGGILAYLQKYGSLTSSTKNCQDPKHEMHENVNDVTTVQNKLEAISQINAVGQSVLDCTNNTVVHEEYGKNDLTCEEELSTNTARMQSHTSTSDITKPIGKFHGECYVFDQRVAVTYGLQPSTTYTTCFVCRHPLTEQDRSNDHYKLGIECPHCYTNSDSANTGTGASTNTTSTNATINRQRHVSRQAQFERIYQKQQEKTSTNIKSKTMKKRQQEEVGQHGNNRLIEKSKLKLCNNETPSHCTDDVQNSRTNAHTNVLRDKSCLHLYDAKEVKLARQR